MRGGLRREWIAAVALVVTLVAVAEWLSSPVMPWPAIAIVSALTAAVASFAGAWRRWLSGAALLGVAVAVAGTARRLERIDGAWAAEREQRIVAASGELGLAFQAAAREADAAALAAVTAARLPRDEVYRVLARRVRSDSLETSAVLFDAAGRPWAWAGRQRLLASPTGDSLAVRVEPYAVVLESRRHAYDGRVAVGQVLLWAHEAVLDGGRSIADRVRRRTGVGVQLFAPAAAPDNADVFDWAMPTTAGDRVLVSIRTIPPEQADVRAATFALGARGTLWLLLLAVVLGVPAMTTLATRALLLVSVVWLPARAPVGTVLGLGQFFAPYSYNLQTFGPFSSSVGVLAISGALVAMGAIALWYRRAHRGWVARGLGLVLAALVPALADELAAGIIAPSAGASVSLWVTWEVAITLATGGVLLLAAALVRGDRVRPAGWAVLGLVIAAGAGAAGTLLWRPDDVWPVWYPFLWLPAVLLAIVPSSRAATSLAVAAVAGCLATVLTWDHDLRARVEAANADIQSLGLDVDPFVVPYLEYFADSVRVHPPSDATQLYTVWRTSTLHADGYPAQLALWDTAGRPLAQLPIDSLDVPPELLSELVRELRPEDAMAHKQLVRIPGVHAVVLVRTAPDRIVSATVGPKSALVQTTRLGRLIEGPDRRRFVHRLTIGLPSGDLSSDERAVRWQRDGWLLRAARLLPLSLGVREVYAAIDLRGPVPLLVRGTLIVLLDLALFALLWLLAERMSGSHVRLPTPGVLRRSFRVRLGVALAAFFVLPVLGFSAWSFLRLAEESSRSRDLLVAQSLRDATAAASPSLGSGRGVPADSLQAVSARIDADLAYYGGGVLTSSSAGVLADLGVIDALLPATEFQELSLRGQPETVGPGPAPVFGERVAYRVVHPGGPPELGVLASPQPADDSRLAAQQLDLGLVVLLAAIGGVILALGSATIVSRSLARPVGDLRRAALAIGRGLRAPPPATEPPLEFEPVFAAFEKSAEEIRDSRAALEAAQQRTDSVLRTVATGVVAVDGGGAILLANLRAVELLGTALPTGRLLLEALARFGEPFRGIVERALGGGPHGTESHELAIDERRLLLTITVLGGDVRGLVLALNDVTDLSRAERVLAWGEMAQQVAHEIKNPLTPLRLGVQHLRRAWRDGRGNFDTTLEETSHRILEEIDRLDTVARAFSRFGAPTEEQAPLDRIDVTAVARDVVQLYRLSSDGARVELEATGPLLARARADELKEVLVNLLENGRQAGAQLLRVQVGDGAVQVSDDGQGIPADLLPRIFEPRFSTNTSGSGLGLAIVKRLVESWGARIDVASEVGRGTTATVRLVA